MSLEGAISMEPVKEKLRNLREHMPNEDVIIHHLGAHLADYLNPTLVPEGFILATELAFYDMEKGVNGFSGKQVSRKLSGYPLQLYAVLRLRIPEIVAAVCPEDFASKVNECYERINQKK